MSAYLASRFAAQYRVIVEVLLAEQDTSLTGLPYTVFRVREPTIAEAAADALGAAYPPLVCTDGIASGSALDLLAGFATAGCVIPGRADFDPAGFTIAGQVLRRAASEVLAFRCTDLCTGGVRPERELRCLR